MSVYKMTEIVGTSKNSFAEAVKDGIKRASKTIRHIGWFEVVEERGRVEGETIEFQVKMKLGFKLED